MSDYAWLVPALPAFSANDLKNGAQLMVAIMAFHETKKGTATPFMGQGQPTYACLFALFQQHYAERAGKPRWGDQSGLIERYADLIAALERGEESVSITNTVTYQDGTSVKRTINLKIRDLEGYEPPRHKKQRPVWSGRR